MADTITPAAPSLLATLPGTLQSHPYLVAIFGLLAVYVNFTRRGNFQWKAFLSVFWACMGGLVGISSAFVLWPLGMSASINWVVARFFFYSGGFSTGIEFRIVEGREHLDVNPAIFIANHQSSLDVLMLGAVMPKNCSIVAKAEMKWYPLIGQFSEFLGGLGGRHQGMRAEKKHARMPLAMVVSQTIFLDRKNHNSAINIFKNAAVKVKSQKISAFIFPEGTRAHSQETDLLPFKKGAFHLAVQAGVPIVPVVVANYSHVYDSKKKTFRAGIVPIKVLTPIPTTGLTDSHEDIEALLNRARDAMLNALKEITPEETKESKKVI
ncbi:hypothetical protein BC938DRAFT_480802 [Jimgerdemannia flammicorona]|uniref:Phospholipid/glycerol acyltransferase domain-containing protein n=1 Tax=Jimgerdemannia flammicorona TaxID=994334 RepID=A0A433QID2_9FUNG|nr:hypothetical protein BC938DRAFT_480802 [Jimgerdemannia flammicorona]